MSLILLLGGALYLYLLYHKPVLVAILLFTLIITNINIDLGGLPLNMRAIITISLFGRTMLDKAEMAKYPPFLNSPLVRTFLLFILYILFISYAYNLFTIELLKITLATSLAVFCIYHYFFLSGNSRVLTIAMIVSGISCFADLAFTYVKYGSFPVRRVVDVLTGGAAEVINPDDILVSDTNHNFFGQICGMCFVFVLTDIIKNKSSKYYLFLLPVMLVGVLMSTSRSTLLAIILAAIIVVFNSIRYNEQRKRIFKIITFSVGALLAGIVLYSTIGMYLKLDSRFVEEVVFRLAEEPIAMLQRALGQNYNIHNLGSMDWREEAASDAYAAYASLKPVEQIFGIGHGGFMARNLGHGLNPHNGILLIMIEYGMVGFCLYLLIIVGAVWQGLRLNNLSASLAVILFTVVYGVGQNGELTAVTTFLFVINLVAENQLLVSERQKKYEMAMQMKKQKLRAVRL